MAVVVLLIAPGNGWVRAADQGTIEYAVKANFLYKFSDYVAWPADALGADGAEVGLCVVGDDPFGAVLDTAVAGERIARHPIALKRLKAFSADAGCRVLYTKQPEALKAAAGLAVLTISEGPAAGSAVITFVIRNNRVRFEIDQQAAALNKLEISSKLLELAVSVKPRVGSAP